jgi:hypothetical protein
MTRCACSPPWIYEAMRLYDEVRGATGRPPRRFHLDERQARELEALTGQRALLLSVEVDVRAR